MKKVKIMLKKSTKKHIHKCKKCKITFRTKKILTTHEKKHVVKQKTISPKRVVKEQDPLEIPDMQYKVIRVGEHPYTCRKCYKGYFTKESLEKHAKIHILRKVEPGKKRFRCDVCAKEFNKLCDVERHMRSHTGEKPCECHICHKRFQQAHNVTKHLKSHHFNIKPFECAICNKMFTRNDILTRHLLTHAAVKPYECTQCEKSFIRPTQLRQHLKRHEL